MSFRAFFRRHRSNTCSPDSLYLFVFLSCVLFSMPRYKANAERRERDKIKRSEKRREPYTRPLQPGQSRRAVFAGPVTHARRFGSSVAHPDSLLQRLVHGAPRIQPNQREVIDVADIPLPPSPPPSTLSSVELLPGPSSERTPVESSEESIEASSQESSEESFEESSQESAESSAGTLVEASPAASPERPPSNTESAAEGDLLEIFATDYLK